jgi:hypothetical protein
MVTILPYSILTHFVDSIVGVGFNISPLASRGPRYTDWSWCPALTPCLLLHIFPIKKIRCVNSNLVQYLLQTDIQKRTEKIQWQIQTLHRDFSPGNPNRENQHILYSYIVLHCLQYNIHIGASGIQNPNPMTWISPKP